MPVRDATPALVDDRYFRGVDPAFLLEAIGERAKATGWMNPTIRTFPLNVTKNAFTDTIEWMESWTVNRTSYVSNWRKPFTSYSPYYSHTASTGSYQNLNTTITSNYRVSSDLSANSNEFRNGAICDRNSVLKIFDDIANCMTFITSFDLYHRPTVLSSSSYSNTMNAWYGNDDS